MALDAEAAQHTISAQIALRIAFSVPASTGVFASRQAPLLSVNSRSRVGRDGRVARNFQYDG